MARLDRLRRRPRDGRLGAHRTTYDGRAGGLAPLTAAGRGPTGRRRGTYGDGLEQRVRDAAPEGVAAALDCVGTDEAVDVSLALVADRGRIVTIAAPARAQTEGFTAIGGAMPASQAYRDSVRADRVHLAGEGRLVVPIARTFPLADARAAAEILMSQHAGGKLVLEP